VWDTASQSTKWQCMLKLWGAWPPGPPGYVYSMSRFHLPGMHTPSRVGSQIVVLKFPHFLHSPTQNSKDLEKTTNSYDPKACKATGGPKELPPYISAVCPLQDPRETHLQSCRTNHWPTAPTGASGLSIREVDRTPGHPADTGHRRQLFG